MNALHWHMSDTQSFPFESKTSPRLWHGAYSTQERYSQRDVAGVVEFARLRGVRVVVEFDVPGHAASWCKGYPSLCMSTNCSGPLTAKGFPSQPCCEPLNVANPETFDRIEALLKECTGGVATTPGKPSAGLFKDNLIHLGPRLPAPYRALWADRCLRFAGGDEVGTKCWESTPSVAAWLRQRNMTGKDA